MTGQRLYSEIPASNDGCEDVARLPPLDHNNTALACMLSFQPEPVSDITEMACLSEDWWCTTIATEQIVPPRRRESTYSSQLRYDPMSQLNQPKHSLRGSSRRPYSCHKYLSVSSCDCCFPFIDILTQVCLHCTSSDVLHGLQWISSKL